MNYKKLITTYKDHNAARVAYRFDTQMRGVRKECSWKVQRYAHAPFTKVQNGNDFKEGYIFRREGPEWGEIVTVNEVIDILGDENEMTIFQNGISFRKEPNDHPFERGFHYFISINGSKVWENGFFLVGTSKAKRDFILSFIHEYRNKKYDLPKPNYGHEVRKENPCVEVPLVNPCALQAKTATELIIEKCRKKLQFYKDESTKTKAEVLLEFESSLDDIQMIYYMENQRTKDVENILLK